MKAEVNVSPESATLRTATAGAQDAAIVREVGPIVPAPARGKKVLSGVVVILLCAAALNFGHRWWEHSLSWVDTDNAYVTARTHQVSSRIAGTVTQVLVEDNQTVEAGAVLLELDRGDLEVKQRQAQAQLLSAEAQVRQSEAQILQAQAQVAREQARAKQAELDFHRAESLHSSAAGAISNQEFDNAGAATDVAKASLKAVESSLQSAEASAGAARAQREVAMANVKDAELQLSYTQIKAPSGGRVGRKNVEVGNRVLAGQALVALVEPEIWVIANFKETQLGRMLPGQKVNITVDAFPQQVFIGHVDSIAPASGAQFALLPPDNATGNFTRIVQRVPVKILFDEESVRSCKEHIVPGMSTVVSVALR